MLTCLIPLLASSASPTHTLRICPPSLPPSPCLFPSPLPFPIADCLSPSPLPLSCLPTPPLPPILPVKSAIAALALSDGAGPPDLPAPEADQGGGSAVLQRRAHRRAARGGGRRRSPRAGGRVEGRLAALSAGHPGGGEVPCCAGLPLDGLGWFVVLRFLRVVGLLLLLLLLCRCCGVVGHSVLILALRAKATPTMVSDFFFLNSCRLPSGSRVPPADVLADLSGRRRSDGHRTRPGLPRAPASAKQVKTENTLRAA